MCDNIVQFVDVWRLDIVLKLVAPHTQEALFVMQITHLIPGATAEI
jgi:hypothetical protein